MDEKTVEQHVCDYAKASGCLVLKLNVKGQVGWPDRLFIYQGKVLMIEFKRPGQVPTPIQQYVHNQLKGAGAQVEVIDNVSQGKELIDVFSDN